MPTSLLALMLAVLGPRLATTPTTLQIKENDKILLMGDSDTLGSNVGDIGTVLHEQYPKLKVEVNAFVSWTAAQMAGYFQRRLEHDKPTIVIMSIGVSEARRTLGGALKAGDLEAHSKEMTKMVTQAQAKGIKVILLAPPLLDEDPKSEGNRRLAMYAAAQKKIAAEKRCGFVDLHNIFVRALASKPQDVQGAWLMDTQGLCLTRTGWALAAVCTLRELGVPDEKIAATQVLP